MSEPFVPTKPGEIRELLRRWYPTPQGVEAASKRGDRRFIRRQLRKRIRQLAPGDLVMMWQVLTILARDGCQ